MAALEALIEEARQRARRRRQRYLGAVLVLVMGLAAYVGFAHGHGHGAKSANRPFRSKAITARGLARNGPLTILTTTSGDDAVETVGRGRPRILWRCPDDLWCGEIVSHDWAPDGKRLAVTFEEIARTDWYPLALHVIDVQSGSDVQIPAGPGSGTGAALRMGCWPATDLAWSPDGAKLAYRCSLDPYLAGYDGIKVDRIDVLDFKGSGYRAVPTPGSAFWPTWSPGGTRIAYSTALALRDHPAVYAVNLDGSQRRLLARDGTAPAWSPDGSRIAYESSCGVRLVTPTGREITPHRNTRSCSAIGPVGLPTWSPDGSKIAIATSSGVYVMAADGTHLHLLSRQTSTTWLGTQLGRPSWRPRA